MSARTHCPCGRPLSGKQTRFCSRRCVRRFTKARCTATLFTPCEHPRATKEEAVRRVKAGEKVAAVAAAMGLKRRTLASWMITYNYAWAKA